MKEELKQIPVLAMYDVRGIQNFIFSTNRIRDIIGASELVENIIIEGLEEVCKQQQWKEDNYIIDWENDKSKVVLGETEGQLNIENVQMQVLFVGGGNAYVLFSKGEICEQVNKLLAKYVLEKTYSLNLAVAVVRKTEDYSVDYANINEEMRKIKAVMPQVKPMGAFPFMAIDSVTGYPLATYDKSGKEYISTEAYLKRAKIPNIDDANYADKILDNMVTQKGEDSMLAVVHIDGNGMGSRIKKIMQDKKLYKDAIIIMRSISMYLKDEFMYCYKKMCDAIDKIAPKVKGTSFEGKLYRKIIVAGDDITFICNDKVALYAVKVFLDEVSKKVMYKDPELLEEENKKKYALSACAGVAFFNSHFPFSDAYEVAESCCSSAKRMAKKEENKANGDKEGIIGCYVDYQICHHINAANLGTYREKQYRLFDAKPLPKESVWNNQLMVQRPYYVAGTGYVGVLDINERNENKRRNMDEVLWKNLRIFHSTDSGKSRYKKLRNAFSLGMTDVENEIAFLESRQIPLPDKGEQNELVLTWYDSLELVDICELGE